MFNYQALSLYIYKQPSSVNVLLNTLIMALITLFGLMLVLSIATITVEAPIKRQSSDDSKLTTLYGGVIFFGEVISKLMVG